MKIFCVLDGICAWDITNENPTVEEATRSHPNAVFVEAPDYVVTGWGYSEGSFIVPTPPKGWVFDAERKEYRQVDENGVPIESDKEREETDMAITYATLIVNGKRTFSQVPELLREKVRQVLIDLDCAELAVA